ncbi:MAG: Nramp family divalent metal transporter [Acidobacteriota bacterium]|nr:Nramp family divalent metal transporter [Acidobacteriota bacterium]
MIRPESDPHVYPSPPSLLQRPTLSSLWVFVGPGVIIASVTIASGELVFASRSGAIFGYGMLWCFLYAGIFKGIQVYTASRHIVLTGEHPMTTWCSMPVVGMAFPLLIVLPAVMLMLVGFSALPEILATFIHRLMGGAVEGAGIGPWQHLEFWLNVWATVVLTACLILALISTYDIVERLSTVILGIMVLCIASAVVILGPNIPDLFQGLFLPRVSDYQPWVLEKYSQTFSGRSPWLEVLLYIGAVGGGSQDYVGYIGFLREKKWGLAGIRVAGSRELAEAARNSASEVVERARIWTRAPLLDTTLSFTFVILVTLLFAILGSMVLNPNRAIPDGSEFLTVQESFLTTLHPQLKWLYRVGVFLAFIGTLYGAFEVYSRVISEGVRSIFPRFVERPFFKSLRTVTIIYCFLGGLLLVWLPKEIAGDVLGRVTFTGVISGGIAACGLWCFAMIWADRYRLPPPLRMSWKLRLATAVAGAVMFSLGVRVIVSYFQGN